MRILNYPPQSTPHSHQPTRKDGMTTKNTDDSRFNTKLAGERLPCSCTIDPNDKMLSSVFWNTFNKVVQCHKCGYVYEPKQHDQPKPTREQISERTAVDGYAWLEASASREELREQLAVEREKVHAKLAKVGMK